MMFHNYKFWGWHTLKILKIHDLIVFQAIISMEGDNFQNGIVPHLYYTDWIKGHTAMAPSYQTVT